MPNPPYFAARIVCHICFIAETGPDGAYIPHLDSIPTLIGSIARWLSFLFGTVAALEDRVAPFYPIYNDA